MENYYKFFKDDAVDEDVSDEDRDILTNDMKDILGDSDELEQMLLAASAEGFRHLAGPASAVDARGSHPHEIIYEDDAEEEYEATEYMAYKFVSHELFIAESND